MRFLLAALALAVSAFLFLQLSAEQRLADARDAVYDTVLSGGPRREDAIAQLRAVADLQPGTEALLLASQARTIDGELERGARWIGSPRASPPGWRWRSRSATLTAARQTARCVARATSTRDPGRLPWTSARPAAPRDTVLEAQDRALHEVVARGRAAGRDDERAQRRSEEAEPAPVEASDLAGDRVVPEEDPV